MNHGPGDSLNNRPLVADANFVRATRDTGYKSTAAAIAELIDNAIQACADEIRVTVSEEWRNEERHVRIAVLDNGSGMSADVLHDALRFGGTDRFDDRSSLGRYGMGLPNSSVSQSRCFEVITWRTPGEVLRSYLDIDEMVTGRLSGVPAPQASPLPVWLHEDLPSHGTAVIWSRCDRLSNRKASTLAKNLGLGLGRIFRRAIWNGIRILINGIPVTAVDPLFNHPLLGTGGGRPYGPALVYDIAKPTRSGSSKVLARFTELPIETWHSMSVEEKRRLGIVGGAGVSILRANREIDYGWHLLGGKRRENYDDWWRCEISFSPDLDELFGVTHSKQGITPTPELRAILCDDLEAIARTLNRRARERFEALREVGPSRASKAAGDRDLLLPVEDAARRKLSADRFTYRINAQALDSSAFFRCSRRGTTIRVIVNEDHAFFHRIYRPALAEKGQRTRFAVETMLLSLARAKLLEGSAADIDLFIDDWSNVMAAFCEK